MHFSLLFQVLFCVILHLKALLLQLVVPLRVIWYLSILCYLRLLVVYCRLVNNSRSGLQSRGLVTSAGSTLQSEFVGQSLLARKSSNMNDY